MLGSRRTLRRAIALLGLLTASASQAASVFLSPPVSAVSVETGTVILGLHFDFTGRTVIGGGLDFAFAGPITFGGFIPSPFLEAANPQPDDTDFTGWGTARADGDFELHIGAFTGFTGEEKLGDLVVGLAGPGEGVITLGYNSGFGMFWEVPDVECPVDLVLLGAVIGISGAGVTPGTPSSALPITPPPSCEPSPPVIPPVQPPVVQPPVYPPPPPWPGYPDAPPDTWVPLPASAWLLLTAFGIGALRSRRRNR